MSEQTERPSPARILGMAWGHAAPLMLEAAVRHRLFDVLDAGPKTLDQLVAETGTSTRGLRALANALVGLELLRKDGDRYALTPESQAFLVSTRPSFQGGLFRHVSTQLAPHWLQLTETVRTGVPPLAVNEEGTGAEFFRDFVEALFPMGYPVAQALASALGVADASHPVSVLDLAAGSGVWSVALAQASPQVRVTAVDWPLVLPVTQRVTARLGVADRYTFVAGDLLEADFGTGHQIATLGHILHSEGEPRSRRLLHKVFASLAPGGTIAIAEMIPSDDRTGPAMPLIFAVNMLLHTQEGDTFTFAEMSAWLQEAGFENPRTLEVPGPSPLVLANRPT